MEKSIQKTEDHRVADSTSEVITQQTPLPTFNMLIGITGHAGVGKDTAADYLRDSYDFYTRAFAGPLKAAISDLFGMNVYDMSREEKEEIHPYWGVSYRQVAQFVGTELFRNHITALSPQLNNFWIKRLEYNLLSRKETFQNSNLVVTDVRFEDEAGWVIRNGGYIIEMTRPGYEGNVGIPGHASEGGIELSESDSFRQDRLIYIQNNKEKKDLYQALDAVVEHILTVSNTHGKSTQNT